MINTINSSYQSLNTANLINRYTGNLETSMTRLTTGVRINSAKDDPSALAASEKIRDRIGGLNQAAENIQNGSTILKMADNAYSNVADIVIRLRELATKSADDGTEAVERSAIRDEADQLVKQIDNYGTMKYNDRLVFDSFNFQIGPESGANMSVAVDDIKASTLGIDGIKDNISTKAGAKGLLDTIAADGTITKGDLTKALDKVREAQQKIGAYENVMGYISDDVSSQITSLESADSTLRDTDIAKEMTHYVRNSVLLQSSQLLLAQHNQNAFSVLTLLQ